MNRVAEQDSLEGLIARLQVGDDYTSDDDWPLEVASIEAAERITVLRNALENVKPLVEAARGLSLGTDWNNGTQAKAHGYRRKLLKSLPLAIAALTTPKIEKE